MYIIVDGIMSRATSDDHHVQPLFQVKDDHDPERMCPCNERALAAALNIRLGSDYHTWNIYTDHQGLLTL